MVLITWADVHSGLWPRPSPNLHSLFPSGPAPTSGAFKQLGTCGHRHDASHTCKRFRVRVRVTGSELKQNDSESDCESKGADPQRRAAAWWRFLGAVTNWKGTPPRAVLNHPIPTPSYHPGHENWAQRAAKPSRHMERGLPTTPPSPANNSC
eukprot:362616-Chlamydomonas_euryale.AAC.5